MLSRHCHCLEADASAERGQLAGSDLARGARASRETGFAVCRLLLQRGARSALGSSTHHVRWPERRRGAPRFWCFGWHTVWLLPPYWHATEPRKHPPTHSSTHL